MSIKKNFFRKKGNKKLIFIILVVLTFFSYLAFSIYDEHSFDDISNDKLISKETIEKEFADEYIDSIKYQIRKNEVFFTGISLNKKNNKKRKFRFIVGKKEYERIKENLKNLGKESKVPKMQQIDNYNNYFSSFSLLEIFIFLYIIHYFYSSTKKNIITCEKSNIFFKDIAGYEEEKKEMKKIVSFLKKPKVFSSIGAKLPKGVLFSGSPGVGKTLLAKAIANEAKVPFYYCSGSEFDEVFVGLGSLRVRKLFSNARENAPCVIFIDEIDSIGKRSNNSINSSEQTLNQFLVELDGFKENSGIIVIAATNRVEVLDKALIRSGRFDKIIFIPLPNKNDREEIFKIHSKNKIIASDVDFKELSLMTTGLSGADIENIMNEAAILSINNKNKEITFSNINEAIDRRILGLEKKSFVISKKEKQIIAFHESGHAIISLTLPNSDKLQKISIVSRAQTGGHVVLSQKDDKLIYTKDEMFSRIVGYLGGRASEEFFFGENNISSGASNDIEMSTYLARLMVVNFGMSKDLGPIKYEKKRFFEDDNNFNFSEQTAREIDQEVKKIINLAYSEAKSIIKRKKEDVELITKTLLEKEVITFKQIECLLKNKKVSKKSNEKLAKINDEKINIK
ncbi:AAA family ATPase [bacterium]|nr:AAA family ATPase [bacterium]